MGSFFGIKWAVDGLVLQVNDYWVVVVWMASFSMVYCGLQWGWLLIEKGVDIYSF